MYRTSRALYFNAMYFTYHLAQIYSVLTILILKDTRPEEKYFISKLYEHENVRGKR